MGLEADGSRLPPNRVLDFGEGGVRKSIESPSPFKPRHTLRRSMAAQQAQENPFVNGSPVRTVKPRSTIFEQEDGEEEDEAQSGADDGPIIMDDDDYYDALPQQDDDVQEVQEDAVEEEPAKRKPGRPRKSGSSINSSQIQHTPTTANMSASRKRTRSSLDGPGPSDASVSHSQISESGRANKQGRSAPVH